MKHAKLMAVAMIGLMMAVCAVPLMGTEETDAEAPTPDLYITGRNNFGQMGNGTTTSVTTPISVGNYPNITDFIATAYTTLFVSDGKLYGMGYNNSGQQGDGTTTNVTTPTRIGSFTNVTKIASTGDTTFIIEDGKLYGMGWNAYGQQGDGTYTNVTTPTRIGSFTNVTDVAVSSYTTFFIDSGKLYGMGYNIYGQQGDGTTTNVTTPTRIGSFTNVTQIAVSSYTTLFIDNGIAYGMGSNRYGELAQGSESHEIPFPVQMGNFTNVTQIAASNNTSFVMYNGQLYGTGDNAYGQIGAGGLRIDSFTAIDGGVNVSSFSISSSTTFYVSDGKLYGMGWNYNGQQGTGDTNNVYTPTRVGNFENVTSVSASTNTTMFIDSGKLYGMGYNSYGQMGQGNTSLQYSPVMISDFNNITQICASSDTTAFFGTNALTVAIESSNTEYGTVSVSEITDIAPGTTITVSRNTLTIGSTTVTATQSSSTPQYYYEFVHWQMDNNIVETGDTVDSSTSITAIFNRDIREYMAYIIVTPEWGGTVSQSSIHNIPYGQTITVSGQTVSFGPYGSATVTIAPDDPQYTYTWNGWTCNGEPIISGTTFIQGYVDIEAHITATPKTYTVSIESSNTAYGTVSVSEITDLAYGTVVTVSGNNLTIGSTTVTATPSPPTHAYYSEFEGWYSNDNPLTSGTIASDMTITARFMVTPYTFTVPIQIDPPSGGTVSVASIPNVPYGTPIIVSGQTITLDSTSSTATVADDDAQYSYTWNGWTYDGQPIISGTTIIEGATPIIANVGATVKTYTVTWIYGPEDDRTTETQTYDYGAMPTHANPADLDDDNMFLHWEPSITAVVGPATYTAVYGNPSKEASSEIVAVIPYMVAIGLIITSASIIHTRNEGEWSRGDFIQFMLGVAISVIALVFILIPICNALS